MLERLWNWLTPDRSWRKVTRTIVHPRLGELAYTGTRMRPDGPLSGDWRVQPPGFARAVSVSFDAIGNEPGVKDLALLEQLLGDTDELFARSRAQMAAAYEQTVERPMPADWPSVMYLDSLDLPSTGGEEDGREWRVSYYCDDALHWFVVSFDGDTVVDVSMEG